MVLDKGDSECRELRARVIKTPPLLIPFKETTPEQQNTTNRRTVNTHCVGDLEAYWNINIVDNSLDRSYLSIFLYIVLIYHLSSYNFKVVY